jgi:hypothetical protein
MVYPRRTHRVRQRHVILNHIENHLRRRRDDSRTACGANDQQQPPLRIEHDRRRHRAQHALARRARVLLALYEAEHVRRPRLCREVVHLIVHEEARSR